MEHLMLLTLHIESFQCIDVCSQ